MGDYYDAYESNELVLQMIYSDVETKGVSVLVATGAISLVSVIFVLSILAISAYKSLKTPEQHLFIRTHVAAYFVSLLICDLAQAIGSLMNAEWINNQRVVVGPFCTAQAVIKQTGNVGTAIWSFVIAVHTFNLLFLRRQIPDYICYGVLVAVWSALGFIVILGTAVVEDLARRGPFYGISGYWCWITPAYPTERYTLEYLFMFLSAGLSFILYSLVFLRLRGNVVVNGWRVRFQRRPTDQTSSFNSSGSGKKDNHLMTVAKQMLWYPVAYTILILPIAASRFSAFAGKRVPFEVTIFTASLFMLSGFVNAVLFTTTRRVIPARSMVPAVIWRKFFGGKNEKYERRDEESFSSGTHGPGTHGHTESQGTIVGYPYQEPDSPTIKPFKCSQPIVPPSTLMNVNPPPPPVPAKDIASPQMANTYPSLPYQQQKDGEYSAASTLTSGHVRQNQSQRGTFGYDHSQPSLTHYQTTTTTTTTTSGRKEEGDLNSYNQGGRRPPMQEVPWSPR